VHSNARPQPNFDFCVLSGHSGSEIFALCEASNRSIPCSEQQSGLLAMLGRPGQNASAQINCRKLEPTQAIEVF